MNYDEPSCTLLLYCGHVMDLVVKIFPIATPSPKHGVGHRIDSALIGEKEHLLAREDHLVQEVDVAGNPALVHLSDYLRSLSLAPVVVSDHPVRVNVPKIISMQHF